MQRKNNILRTTPSKRSGFALIMAIAVIVVISTLLAFVLSLTAETGKRTTDVYLYEQAMLHSKSAAELALLKIAQNQPCSVSSLNYHPSNTASISYDVNVSLLYVYTAPSPCASAVGDSYFDINTSEQNGSVLMDITVTTDEGSEPIRYFRRIIQKL